MTLSVSLSNRKQTNSSETTKCKEKIKTSKYRYICTIIFVHPQSINGTKCFRANSSIFFSSSKLMSHLLIRFFGHVLGLKSSTSRCLLFVSDGVSATWSYVCRVLTLIWHWLGDLRCYWPRPRFPSTETTV